MNRISDFINANTKTSQMKHWPFWDMLLFTDPFSKIYRPEKIAGKTDWTLKLTSLNMLLLNNLQYICNICIYIRCPK